MIEADFDWRQYIDNYEDLKIHLKSEKEAREHYINFGKKEKRTYKMKKREELSKKYLNGNGVEIGALHRPLKLFDVNVKYIDRMNEKELREQYPELNNDKIYVDIIDDGEKLEKIKEGELDFIIANHFLEHCENLIGTLEKHLTKIKRGGILYYAVPDKRYTFDIDREMTTYEHILEDYKDGGEKAKYDHYKDWVYNIKVNKEGGNEKEKIKDLINRNYSIHFHVWDYDRFKEIMENIRNYLNNFELVEYTQNQDIDNEIIIILRKE